MKKKIVGILVCTLVIATVWVPMAGSITISSKHGSTDPTQEPLNTQSKSAFSKRGDNLDNWGITESIDLTGATKADLMYSQHYNIVPVDGPDKGYVKISDDGGSSWTKLCEVQGRTTEWEQNRIEINKWTDKTVLIGFEYKTEANSISVGWYIDDIIIDADGSTVYDEDFEDYDIGDDWGDWIIWLLDSLNEPPFAPTINGPDSGNPNVPYTYTFHAYDPNFDNVSYYIEWGDGTLTDWTEFQPSGVYSEDHAWSEEGTYTIRAKAKDIYEAESDWSTLQVSIKKSKLLTNSLFLQLLERLLERIPSSLLIFNRIIEFPVTR